MVAPFLAQRIWGRPAFAVDLMGCRQCGFVFFNPRLEPEDEARLYAGYRGEEYQRMRFRSEPWYTERFNRNLFNPAYMDARRTKLAELFESHLKGVSVRKLLDFGGNDGDLVRGLISGAEAYVYDISGVTPVDGVERCSDLANCRAHQFDLIVSSNVLEHVGFPREVIRQIAAAANSGTLVFIEVPYESPLSRGSLLKRIAQEGVLMVTRPRIALSLLGPGMLYWMQEHINFFTPKALEMLMSSTGWKVVDSGIYEIRPSTGKASMTWCLAKLGPQ
ncbi:MAG: class I SAM-dependent methyltransferase [Bryobacteraceae bacterium]|jgi:hypothetical protein